jgi:hypothetical protein
MENCSNLNHQNNENLSHNIPKQKTIINTKDIFILENETQASSSGKKRNISTAQKSGFDLRRRIKENEIRANFTSQTLSNKNNRTFAIPLSILRQNKKLLLEPKPIVKRPILRKRKLFHLVSHQSGVPLHLLQVI